MGSAPKPQPDSDFPSLADIENSTAAQLDAAREQIPEGAARDYYDVQVGAAKGVYNFGKGIVEGTISLANALKKVLTDEETQKQVWEKAKSLAADSAKLQYGTPEQKKEVIDKAAAYASDVADKAKAEMKQSWEEAKAAGKEKELAANWATQGLLNIASLFIGAGELKAASKAGEVAEAAEAAGKAASAVKKAETASNLLNKENKVAAVSSCEHAAQAAETSAAGAESNAAKLAKAVSSKAALSEKAVTSDLSKLSESNGGKLAGLEYKLKTEQSLARKIAEDAKQLNLTEDAAAGNINDALRYTMTYPPDKLTESATKVMADLEAAGYKKVKVKNTFAKEGPYKGLNTVFQSPDGQNFELQFHTPESFHVKDVVTHGMFERARLSSTPLAEQKAIEKEMTEISSKITMPKNIDSVKNFP